MWSLTKLIALVVLVVASVSVKADSIFTEAVATVERMAASSPEVASIAVWRDSIVRFVEGNPLPGECSNRFIYDGQNAGLVEMLSTSRLNNEPMRLVIEDTLPGITQDCFVRRVASI